MRYSRAMGILAFAALLALAPLSAQIFPYRVHQTTLENGLRVVIVPYDSPGTVAFMTEVRTGSRDEVEPGHSGFAHFFEHMMFRGTDRYSEEAYNDILKRMGADSNAFTTDDRTVYYIVGPAAELETMMDIESDRFQHLEYGEDVFRREALAVLGEYNKNISNPFLPMYERLRALAFTKHTYGHTTMGYLEDIQAMPEYYDYSLSFFDRFYRPENAILLLVGDIDPEEAGALAEKYWGGWQPGYQAPTVATEPAQEQPHQDHIDWKQPISPHLMVGYKAPAFSDTTVDTAALDLISQLLFSESAPLYKKLVVDEQWVDFIAGSYSDHRDPYLFMIYSRIKSEENIEKVRKAIAEHVGQLQAELVDGDRLERIKSHLRYQFALGLDSPSSVAFTLAGYLNMTGDSETVNRVYERYQNVTPEDIQRLAVQVFRTETETAITLSHSPNADADTEGES